jgi:hypothetical protein
LYRERGSDQLAPERFAQTSEERKSILKTDSMIHSAIDLLQVMAVEMSSIESLIPEEHTPNEGDIINLIAKIQEEMRMEGDLLRMTRRELGVRQQERDNVAVRTLREYLTTTN